MIFLNQVSPFLLAIVDPYCFSIHINQMAKFD